MEAQGFDGGAVVAFVVAVLGSGGIGAAIPALVARWKPRSDRLGDALDRSDRELARAHALLEVHRQLDDAQEEYIAALRDHNYREAKPPPPPVPDTVRDLKRLIVDITLGRAKS